MQNMTGTEDWTCHSVQIGDHQGDIHGRCTFPQMVTKAYCCDLSYQSSSTDRNRNNQLDHRKLHIPVRRAGT
jgi:hypothetical protein